MEEEEDIGFADYSEGEKPCGFCISHAGTLFYKGLRVRYAYESTVGINCVMARYNKYASYNVYAFPKFWREFNQDC